MICQKLVQNYVTETTDLNTRLLQFLNLSAFHMSILHLQLFPNRVDNIALKKYQVLTYHRPTL